MIAGIGLLAWHYAVYHGKEGPLTPPAKDPLQGLVLTPSMMATAKYFWLVLALFLVQILLGATTAHFQVEGQYLYGFKLAEILPYALTRTWHTQLAVLWIATIVFMAGGIFGTFHHLYFTGTTIAVVALGASFSALEVVPLALIGSEAYETWSHSKATPWMAGYKWPIMFFIAVSFWNLVGAGLFGFLINTPLALYYMQGLTLMALLTLLPLGLLQLNAVLENGYWYARSAEFMDQPIIHLLVWMRVPGDTIFSIGALLLAWFVLRLWIAPKKN